MTLIVETGAGVYQANSYSGRGFVRNYLRNRNDVTAWDAATTAEQEAALIQATDYVDRRFGKRYRGRKEFTELTVPDYNIADFLVNPTNNDTVTIGSTVYTFKSAAAVANEVTIGASLIDSATNLVSAINGTDGVGTVAHTDVTARKLQDELVIVEAIITPLPSEVVTLSSDTNSIVWDLGVLGNGLESTEQILGWPRLYAYYDSGVQIIGIPVQLIQAVAEYANRALAAALLPDPEMDAAGGIITRKYEKVGPIEQAIDYQGGTQGINIIKPYPMADKLMRDLIRAGGGVIR